MKIKSVFAGSFDQQSILYVRHNKHRINLNEYSFSEEDGENDASAIDLTRVIYRLHMFMGDPLHVDNRLNFLSMGRFLGYAEPFMLPNSDEGFLVLVFNNPFCLRSTRFFVTIQKKTFIYQSRTKTTCFGARFYFVVVPPNSRIMFPDQEALDCFLMVYSINSKKTCTSNIFIQNVYPCGGSSSD